MYLSLSLILWSGKEAPLLTGRTVWSADELNALQGIREVGDLLERGKGLVLRSNGESNPLVEVWLEQGNENRCNILCFWLCEGLEEYCEI